MQELQKDLAAKGVVWLLVDSVNTKNFSYRTPAAGAQGIGGFENRRDGVD